MFTQLKFLIKKDIKEFKNNLKVKRQNIFGVILYGLFILSLLGVGTYLYMELAKAYVFNGMVNEITIFNRKKELLVITLAVFLILNIFSGVKNIYKKLSSNADSEKLSILPINDKTIFIYKILYIFAKTLLSCAITIIPISIVFGIVCKMGAMFYIWILPIIFVFTFICIGISSILVIPYYYFKKFTESRYFLLIIIYTIIMGALFYFYSLLLKALKSLLVSGNLIYFFNEEKYAIINKISNNLFPANLISSLMLNKNIALNVILIIVLCLALFGLGLLICGKFNASISKQDSQNSSRKIFQKFKQKNSFWSLVCRELIEIIRKPSFAFSLFVIAVDLPILVYISADILNSLVFNLVYIDLSFLISFFVILMFALLANTFCASNISREGKNFGRLSMLPLSVKQILLPKILVCFTVSFFSVLASVIVLIGTGMVSLLQGLGIWFVVECICLAENLFATKYDLRHPKLTNGIRAEGNLSTPSMTATTILAFLLSLALMGGIFTYSVLKMLRGQVVNKLIWYVLPCVAGLFILAITLFYFLKGIKKMEAYHEK